MKRRRKETKRSSNPNSKEGNGHEKEKRLLAYIIAIRNLQNGSSINEEPCRVRISYCITLDNPHKHKACYHPSLLLGLSTLSTNHPAIFFFM
jgi:hypothetical protein